MGAPGCCPCCISVSVSLCPWYLARNVMWMSQWCPAVWTTSHQSWRVSPSTSHMNTTALGTGSAALSLPSGSVCLSVLPSLILSYCTLTTHYHYNQHHYHNDYYHHYYYNDYYHHYYHNNYYNSTNDNNNHTYHYNNNFSP